MESPNTLLSPDDQHILLSWENKQFSQVGNETPMMFEQLFSSIAAGTDQINSEHLLQEVKSSEEKSEDVSVKRETLFRDDNFSNELCENNVNPSSEFIPCDFLSHSDIANCSTEVWENYLVNDNQSVENLNLIEKKDVNTGNSYGLMHFWNTFAAEDSVRSMVDGEEFVQNRDVSSESLPISITEVLDMIGESNEQSVNSDECDQKINNFLEDMPQDPLLLTSNEHPAEAEVILESEPKDQNGSKSGGNYLMESKNFQETNVEKKYKETKNLPFEVLNETRHQITIMYSEQDKMHKPIVRIKNIARFRKNVQENTSTKFLKKLFKARVCVKRLEKLPVSKWISGKIVLNPLASKNLGKNLKKKRKMFTLEEKNQILNELEAGASQAMVLEKYGISGITLYGWIINRQKIKDLSDTAESSQRSSTVGRKTAAQKRKKRPRFRFSTKQKKEILDELDNGASITKTIQKYGMAEITLCIWINNKQKIQDSLIKENLCQTSPPTIENTDQITKEWSESLIMESKQEKFDEFDGESKAQVLEKLNTSNVTPYFLRNKQKLRDSLIKVKSSSSKMIHSTYKSNRKPKKAFRKSIKNEIFDKFDAGESKVQVVQKYQMSDSLARENVSQSLPAVINNTNQSFLGTYTPDRKRKSSFILDSKKEILDDFDESSSKAKVFKNYDKSNVDEKWSESLVTRSKHAILNEFDGKLSKAEVLGKLNTSRVNPYFLRNKLKLHDSLADRSLNKSSSEVNYQTDGVAKKSRKYFTLTKKNEILDEYDAGSSKTQLVEKYGMSHVTLSVWIRDKQKIRNLLATVQSSQTLEATIDETVDDRKKSDSKELKNIHSEVFKSEQEHQEKCCISECVHVFLQRIPNPLNKKNENLSPTADTNSTAKRRRKSFSFLEKLDQLEEVVNNKTQNEKLETNETCVLSKNDTDEDQSKNEMFNYSESKNPTLPVKDVDEQKFKDVKISGGDESATVYSIGTCEQSNAEENTFHECVRNERKTLDNEIPVNTQLPDEEIVRNSISTDKMTEATFGNNTVKRKKLFSLREKVQILDEMKNGKTKSELYEEHSLDKTTLDTWIKNEKKIRNPFLNKSTCNSELSNEASVNLAPEKQKKRKLLSLLEKIQIMDEVKNGRTPKEVSQEYGIRRDTIRSWLRSEQSMREKLAGENRKKFLSIEPIIGKSLADWYHMSKLNNIKLSNLILKEKAIELHNFHGVKDLFTTDWLDKWRKKHHIPDLSCINKKKQAHGNALYQLMSTVMNAVEEESLLQCQIFKCDKTVISYKSLPNKRFADDLATIMTCSNADGSLKLPVLFGEYNSQTVKSLLKVEKNCEFPVFYQMETKICIDGRKINEWFNAVFIPRVTDFLNARNLPLKVILIAENVADDVFKKQAASDLQTHLILHNLDSIIGLNNNESLQSIKMNYEYKLLSSVINVQNNAGNLDRHLENIDFKNFIVWIRDSWDEVKPSTIVSCWKKILPNEFLENEQEINALVNEFLENKQEINAFTILKTLKQIYEFRDISEDDFSYWLASEDFSEEL